MPKGEYVAARDESNFSGSCKVQLLRSSARWSSDIEREVIYGQVNKAYMCTNSLFIFLILKTSIQFIMPTWNVSPILSTIFI
jgi:shikimate kinase